jgi:hypothetical protein
MAITFNNAERLEKFSNRYLMKSGEFRDNSIQIYSMSGNASGYSGESGSGMPGYSGYSGYSGIDGVIGGSGYSGISGYSGYSADRGFSGWSGYSGSPGSLAGISYFPSDVSSDLVDHNYAYRIPDGTPEVWASGYSDHNVETLIAEFISPSGDPGVSWVDGGNWLSRLWAKINYLGPDTHKVITKVLSITPTGDETERIIFTSDELIDVINPQESDNIVSDPGFAIGPTDRLVFRYYARSTSLTPTEFILYYEGSEHTTYVQVPIVTQGYSGVSGASGYSGTPGSASFSGYSGYSG